MDIKILMVVFGESLNILFQKTGKTIPPFLEKCFHFLLKTSHLTPGLFTYPIPDRVMDPFISKINATYDIDIPKGTSPIIISNIIVKFLAQIPKSLLYSDCGSQWDSIPEGEHKDDKEMIRKVRKILKNMPIYNQLLTSRIFGFFKLLTKHSEITKLNQDKLLSVLSPILIVRHDKYNWIISHKKLLCLLTNYKKIFHHYYAIEKGHLIPAENWENKFANAIKDCEQDSPMRPRLSTVLDDSVQKKMCRPIRIPPITADGLLLKLLSRERRLHLTTDIPQR